jgi:hypothetical protein
MIQGWRAICGLVAEEHEYTTRFGARSMAKRLNEELNRKSPGAPFDRDQLSRDVRNQITVISGRAQLLRRRIRRGTLDVTYLDRSLAQIETAAARLTAYLNRLDSDG